MELLPPYAKAILNYEASIETAERKEISRKKELRPLGLKSCGGYSRASKRREQSPTHKQY